MRTVMVRYTVRAHAAAENEALVRSVFAQLEQEQPDGFRYRSFKLADGVTFVHLATYDGEAPSPLNGLSSFKAFLAGIKERCVEQPVAVDAQVIGSFEHDASSRPGQGRDAPPHASP